MIFTVELKKEYALRILEDLQDLDAIELRPALQQGMSRPRMFQAVSISTQSLSFDRDEANER